MPETVYNSNKAQDVIKKELPESAVCATSCSTATKSLQQSLVTKPSPAQDELELIDITTVKVEDSSDSKNDTNTDIKNQVDDTKQIDDCTDGKVEDGDRVNDKGGMRITGQCDSSNTQSSMQQIDSNNIQPTPVQSALENNTTNSTTNFEEIQNQLKKTLDHIEQRHMVSGFRTLSDATNAVVENCEQLGLTSDDHPYNAIDREQFWAGLNNCWLYALAQRQEPSSSEEKMTDQQLCSLRERVVAWADKLERYGLVDYEMGWWEADILAAMDAILATNYASAQAVAQAAVAKAAVALFGDETSG